MLKIKDKRTQDQEKDKLELNSLITNLPAQDQHKTGLFREIISHGTRGIFHTGITVKEDYKLRGILMLYHAIGDPLLETTTATTITQLS
ncbi:MAG: hypothetical protein AB2693_23540 [Candidatus Thiodiazotropha sp.]